MSHGGAARRYLRRRRNGVLSTLSRKFAGYPFGSVVLFVLDHAAQPIILVSRLAEHTRNIETDPRVSLIVSEPGDDAQAGARLTLIGDAARSDGHPGLGRYLNFFPDARHLIAMGDFFFYVITPRALRFIGGFGNIQWIDAAHYAPPANDLAAREDAIVAQLNAEHARNLRDCCGYSRQRDVDVATMIGLDCDGFDARADGEILRIEFDEPVTDAVQARAALAAMARKAHSA